MQRRAAAIFAAFFLLVGAGSYTLIATAQQPQVEFDDPAYELQQNDTVELAGEQYNVSSISASAGSDGGGVTRSATISYVNESARYTETWDNNSTVTFDGEEWTVVVPNESDPSSATLRESIDRAGILANDTNADNETVTRNGQAYVIVTENNSSTLVPASVSASTPGASPTRCTRTASSDRCSRRSRRAGAPTNS